MSKKTKRQIRKETTTSTANVSNGTSMRAPSSSTPLFNPDYSYVTKDLRRIGLLAGTFITVLVILSFILR